MPSTKPTRPTGDSDNDSLVRFGGRLAGRAVAVIAGIVLMIIGLALGVTMVLLPLAIPLGLIGLLILLSALSLRREKT